MAPDGPPHIAADAAPLTHGESDIFEDTQAPEQLRHLKGAHQPTLDARGLRQSGDLGAVEMDVAGIRCQGAGDQIDKAGFAGAVGTDQRLPRAALEPEIDPVGDRERTEAFAEPARFERRGGAHRRPRARRHSRSHRPSTPPRAKLTSKTIKSPIQKYQ